MFLIRSCLVFFRGCVNHEDFSPHHEDFLYQQPSRSPISPPRNFAVLQACLWQCQTRSAAQTACDRVAKGARVVDPLCQDDNPLSMSIILVAYLLDRISTQIRYKYDQMVLLSLGGRICLFCDRSTCNRPSASLSLPHVGPTLSRICC